MGKTNLKKLVSLSLAAMFCASIPAINATSALATDGAGSELLPVEDNSFVVEQTASIRVSDPSGMRFCANIGADLVDDVQSADEFGFLIFPHAYLSEDANAGKADWQVKGKDGAEEYGLWDYVKVSTTEMDGLIYQREKDGKYCVNGVLHTVLDETMEFSAIAYYVKGGETVYADFNKDFSRSLSYVAKWAYISEPAKRSAIRATFDWLNTDEFTINSGKELQMLSNAVSADNTLEGVSFSLAKTIAVGSDYTPVPAEFAGTWSWNSYAILVVDNAAGRAFVNDKYNKAATRLYNYYQYRNGVAVMSSKLIDVANTMFTSDGVNAINDTRTTYEQGVAVSTEVTDAQSKPYYVDYTGTAVGYTVGNGSGKSKAYNLSLTTNNWAVPINTTQTALRSELEAMKELYNEIKFRLYVEYDNSATSHATYDVRMNVQDCGVLFGLGFNKTANPLPEGYWMEVSFTIDEFLTLCETRISAFAGTTVTVGATTGVKVASMMIPMGEFNVLYDIPQDVYFGDCVFVK